MNNYRTTVLAEDTEKISGIASNDRYLFWIEESRFYWLENLGINFREMVEKDHFVLVVCESKIRYLAPAKAGDRIEVETEMIEFSKASARFRYKIFLLQDNHKIRILVEAEATLMGMDSVKKRPRRIPEKYFILLSKFKSEKFD